MKSVFAHITGIAGISTLADSFETNSTIDTFVRRLKTQYPEYDFEASFAHYRKYVTIIQYNRNLAREHIWGFIAIHDIPEKRIKRGDLLKPADYNIPSNTTIGNVFEDTAQYDRWGPCLSV